MLLNTTHNFHNASNLNSHIYRTFLHFIVGNGELHLVTDRRNLQGNMKWNVRERGSKSANMTKHGADKNSNTLTRQWTFLPELSGRISSAMVPHCVIQLR